MGDAACQEARKKSDPEPSAKRWSPASWQSGAMNKSPQPVPLRERQLAAIERSLRESERRLSALAGSDRDDAMLDEVKRRIAQARADHERLSREACASQLAGVADHLARWIGNCDTPPTPRRLPPLPLGDPRRRD